MILSAYRALLSFHFHLIFPRPGIKPSGCVPSVMYKEDCPLLYHRNLFSVTDHIHIVTPPAILLPKRKLAITSTDTGLSGDDKPRG